MKPIEISNLDQHLKPIKIDGLNAPIELSTEAMRISETATFSKDLTIEGDLNILGISSIINFTDHQKFDTRASSNSCTFYSQGLIVNSAQFGAVIGEDLDSTMVLQSSADKDCSLLFLEASTPKWRIGHDATDNSLKFDIGAVGGNTFLTLTTAGTLTAAGDIVSGDDIAVASSGRLCLDGIGGHTFIVEHGNDYVRHVVGNEVMMSLDANGGDGNQVLFDDASVGFTQLEPTYDATTVVVDFRFSNKQFVTFDGGNIANMTLYFPNMSGNFVLLLKQDGTGGRTVTNWKAHEFDESAADGSYAVKFAGLADEAGPTLTTDANHVDILSFYWDADNEFCYGVASLDFRF